MYQFVLFFFLFYCFYKKKYYLFNNNFSKFFFIFWVYICFNSIFAKEVLVSLKVSIPYIRYGIFVILIVFLNNHNKNFTNTFSKFLLITFIIVLIDSYIQYFFGANVFGMVSPHPSRLSSFFGDEMVVGSFLSRLFPLVLFSLIVLSHEENKNYKYSSLILLVLTDVIIYLSGERTAFGILLINTILFIVLINQMKFLRIITFIFSICIIIFISLSNETVKERMVTQTIEGLGYNQKEIKAFSSVHQQHYETALNIYKDNPIIGVGVKMFRHECKNKKYVVGKFGCTSHPHNMHIQSLTETGIVGYIFVLFVLFLISIKFVRYAYQIYIKKKKFSITQDLQTCILIGIFSNIFPFLPSGNIYNNWISIIYFLPVGFYFYTIYGTRT